MSRKPRIEGPLGDANNVRMIDGHPHVPMMWLVLDQRADGTPTTLRLLQDDHSFSEEFIAAGLCTQEEVASGEAQQRLQGALQPVIHVLWTPQRFKVNVPEGEIPPEIVAAMASANDKEKD